LCQIGKDRETGQAKHSAASSGSPADPQTSDDDAMCQIQEDEPQTLPPNWHGFRFDERGNMVTRSGYKCSPNYLEGMLWLAGCYRFEILQYLIRSDEAKGALRPLLETADMDPEGALKPTRLQLVEDQERVTGDALEASPRVQEDRRAVAPVKPQTPDQDQEHARKERGRQTSAAKEPPLQRLRRAAAGQIFVTPSSGVGSVAGAHAPTPELGAFPLI
jgi:hypothetical protein